MCTEMTKGEALSKVEANGLALQYVPDGIKDIAICIIAVKQNSSALQYVPENLFYITLIC
jgi:hypothetical protein